MQKLVHPHACTRTPLQYICPFGSWLFGCNPIAFYPVLQVLVEMVSKEIFIVPILCREMYSFISRPSGVIFVRDVAVALAQAIEMLLAIVAAL